VEVGTLNGGVAVRDSKNTGVVLVISSGQWSALVKSL
jgi:hypothetical protein